MLFNGLMAQKMRKNAAIKVIPPLAQTKPQVIIWFPIYSIEVCAYLLFMDVWVYVSIYYYFWGVWYITQQTLKLNFDKIWFWYTYKKYIQITKIIITFLNWSDFNYFIFCCNFIVYWEILFIFVIFVNTYEYLCMCFYILIKKRPVNQTVYNLHSINDI